MYFLMFIENPFKIAKTTSFIDILGYPLANEED